MLKSETKKAKKSLPLSLREQLEKIPDKPGTGGRYPLTEEEKELIREFAPTKAIKNISKVLKRGHITITNFCKEEGIDYKSFRKKE